MASWPTDVVACGKHVTLTAATNLCRAWPNIPRAPVSARRYRRASVCKMPSDLPKNLRGPSRPRPKQKSNIVSPPAFLIATGARDDFLRADHASAQRNR
jgi:hypothetical protein